MAAPFVKNDKDSFYNYINNFEKQDRANEVVRLLYVVLTRAKKKIFILGEFEECNSSEYFYASKANSLQSILVSALDCVSVEEFKFPLKESIEKNKNTRKTSVLTKIIQKTSKTYHYEPYKEPELHKINLEFDWATNIARFVGIIVHEILERIDDSAFNLR